jgi:hypothetical protein
MMITYTLVEVDLSMRLRAAMTIALCARALNIYPTSDRQK